MTPRKISDLKNYDDVHKMRFDYDDCRNEIEQMLDEQFFSGAHIEEMLKLAATILKNQKVLHDTEFEKMVNDKANTEVLAQYLVSNYYFSEEQTFYLTNF